MVMVSPSEGSQRDDGDDSVRHPYTSWAPEDRTRPAEEEHQTVISFETAVAESGATVIEATGRLDMVAAPQLKALVRSAIGEARTPVVVELSQVQFMDSTGLGALISGLRATRQAGSDLRIAGATAQVLSVLSMTRIDRVMRPYPSVEDALHAE
jgi:anti-sigma B factor antagonist